MGEIFNHWNHKKNRWVSIGHGTNLFYLFWNKLSISVKHYWRGSGIFLTRKNKNSFQKPMQWLCQADATSGRWIPPAKTIQISVFIVSLFPYFDNDRKWQVTYRWCLLSATTNSKISKHLNLSLSVFAGSLGGL